MAGCIVAVEVQRTAAEEHTVAAAVPAAAAVDRIPGGHSLGGSFAAPREPGDVAGQHEAGLARGAIVAEGDMLPAEVDERHTARQAAGRRVAVEGHSRRREHCCHDILHDLQNVMVRHGPDQHCGHLVARAADTIVRIAGVLGLLAMVPREVVRKDTPYRDDASRQFAHRRLRRDG